MCLNDPLWPKYTYVILYIVMGLITRRYILCDNLYFLNTFTSQRLVFEEKNIMIVRIS